MKSRQQAKVNSSSVVIGVDRKQRPEGRYGAGVNWRCYFPLSKFKWHSIDSEFKDFSFHESYKEHRTHFEKVIAGM